MHGVAGRSPPTCSLARSLAHSHALTLARTLTHSHARSHTHTLTHSHTRSLPLSHPRSLARSLASSSTYFLPLPRPLAPSLTLSLPCLRCRHWVGVASRSPPTRSLTHPHTHPHAHARSLPAFLPPSLASSSTYFLPVPRPLAPSLTLSTLGWGGRPLSTDSLQLDAQYFSEDKTDEQGNSTMASVSSFVAVRQLRHHFGFWRDHFFRGNVVPSSVPPHARCWTCSDWCPCALAAHWCLRSGVPTNSRPL